LLRSYIAFFAFQGKQDIKTRAMRRNDYNIISSQRAPFQVKKKTFTFFPIFTKPLSETWPLKVADPESGVFPAGRAQSSLMKQALEPNGFAGSELSSTASEFTLCIWKRHVCLPRRRCERTNALIFNPINRRRRAKEGMPTNGGSYATGWTRLLAALPTSLFSQALSTCYFSRPESINETIPLSTLLIRRLQFASLNYSTNLDDF
jgi:hypothetical protein